MGVIDALVRVFLQRRVQKKRTPISVSKNSIFKEDKARLCVRHLGLRERERERERERDIYTHTYVCIYKILHTC